MTERDNLPGDPRNSADEPDGAPGKVASVPPATAPKPATFRPETRELIRAAHAVLALWSPGLYNREHCVLSGEDPSRVAPAINGALATMHPEHYMVARNAFIRLQGALEAIGSRPEPGADPGWR